MQRRLCSVLGGDSPLTGGPQQHALFMLMQVARASSHTESADRDVRESSEWHSHLSLSRLGSLSLHVWDWLLRDTRGEGDEL
ncbi:Hypothetical predicted protein, partial [Xyrichtys novacula]